MVRYTITPWRTHTDLLTVRSQLYNPDSSNPDSKSTAIARIMAWKLRGNLPHAVESTALLMDAQLHHSTTSTSNNTSIFSIRAVYSAAFTRFVTGFCDIGRNKERSLEPSSMLEIARQIGMPVHFVALRHEATHEELPSVGRLVKATEKALAWLWEVYWARLEGGEEGMDVVAIREQAKGILKGFRSERLEFLRAKKKKGQDDGVERTAKACAELMRGGEAKLEAFVSVLLQEKLLSPSKRELGAALDGAYLIWDDLLIRLQKERKSVAGVLISALLRALGSPSSSPQWQEAEIEAFAMWVLHVLYGDRWQAAVTDRQRQALKKQSMHWCCMYPGQWTHWLGKQMLQGSDSDFQEDWEEILEASQLKEGQGVVLEDPNAMILDDVDSLSRRASSDDGESGGWRLLPPMHTPIGVVAR